MLPLYPFARGFWKQLPPSGLRPRFQVRYYKKILLPILLISLLNLKSVSAQTTQTSWYMAGANPQRTSWITEGISGKLYPQWYVPIEAKIPSKVQIIAGNNTIFMSSASCVYAFDSATGNLKWVYPL